MPVYLDGAMPFEEVTFALFYEVGGLCLGGID